MILLIFQRPFDPEELFSKGFLLDNPGIPRYITKKLLIRALKDREKKSLMRNLSAKSAFVLFIAFSLSGLLGCGHQKSSQVQPTTAPNSEYENPVKTQILSLNKRYENIDSRLSEDHRKIEALEKQLASINQSPKNTDASHPSTPVGATASKDMQGKESEKKSDRRQNRASLGPEALYRTAYREYTKRNYRGAIVHFQEFVDTYPSNNLANNALYWIGESYYDQYNLQKAISTFLGLVDRFPRGVKAPDALLKVGICYFRLKDPEKAKAFLNRAIDDYPFSDAAREAKARLDHLDQ